MHSLICVLQVRFSCSTQINLSNKELSRKCVLQEAALEYFDNKPRINYSLKLADTKISSHPVLRLDPRILKAWIKIRYLKNGEINGGRCVDTDSLHVEVDKAL